MGLGGKIFKILFSEKCNMLKKVHYYAVAQQRKKEKRKARRKEERKEGSLTETLMSNQTIKIEKSQYFRKAKKKQFKFGGGNDIMKLVKIIEPDWINYAKCSLCRRWMCSKKGNCEAGLQS